MFEQISIPAELTTGDRALNHLPNLVEENGDIVQVYSSSAGSVYESVVQSGF